jgi:CubicO group peptidase (beta-lactamase class C family)
MSQKLGICLSIFLFSYFSITAFSQETIRTKALDGIPELIEGLMSKWKIPGMAVGVVRDGEIIYMEGFGFRDSEKKLPVTTKTVFGIGSISKSFTAMSVAMLIDDKKLKWDTPVIEYLPDFKLYDDYATQHATPRDLLCHRTGMAEHILMIHGSPFSREEIYQRLHYLEPDSGFREKYQYNNLMYVTAGYLVGRVNGGTWEDFVKQRILEPLQMESTNFSLGIKEFSDFSLPYMFSEGEVITLPLRNRDASDPAGGMNSNVEDMIKWLELFLDQGKVCEKQLISVKNLNELISPQMPVSYTPGSAVEAVQDYGMGWNIQPYQGHHLVHHGGWIDGYVSWISFMPFDNIGIVVLCNMSDCDVPYLLHYVIYDRLLGIEKIDWNKFLESHNPAYLRANYRLKSVGKLNPAKLPVPLKEFEGTYENPGYGRIVIVVENEKPYALFNGEKMELIYSRKTVFVTEHLLDDFSGRKVTFILNDLGKIDRLEISLQPRVKDIVFTRVED